MLNVFTKVLARCCVCDTPTDERYKIGDKYYCADDYNRYEDKLTDAETKENDRKIRKLMTNAD